MPKVIEQEIAETLKPFAAAWKRFRPEASDFFFGENDRDHRIIYMHLGTKRPDQIETAHKAFEAGFIPTRSSKRIPDVLIISEKHFSEISASSVAEAVTFLQEQVPLGLFKAVRSPTLGQPQR